ncbi:MAG: 50S ribosomal protein L6 [Thermoprotei archaeon]|nr:50S ribosomal protein L6 [TACK group archaeon]
MPKALMLEEKINPPAGVTMRLTDDGEVRVSGPLGTLSRRLPGGDYEIVSEGEALVVRGAGLRKEQRAMFGTVVALIRGMIEGVTKGFEKELIIAYSHFPMNVKVEGSRVVIENFIGERGKRYANVVGDTKVEVSGDRIRVSGPDKYAVGQTAANISSACNLSDYDRRVFQDGIFVRVRS